jgi:hypothetical protein
MAKKNDRGSGIGDRGSGFKETMVRGTDASSVSAVRRAGDVTMLLKVDNGHLSDGYVNLTFSAMKRLRDIIDTQIKDALRG